MNSLITWTLAFYLFRKILCVIGSDRSDHKIVILFSETFFYLVNNSIDDKHLLTATVDI